MDKLLALASEVKKNRNQIKDILQTPPEVHHFVGEKGVKGLQGKEGVAGVAGLKGADGKKGVDGKDGISIVDAGVDFDNSLSLVMSDGTTIELGQLNLPKGNEGMVQTLVRGTQVDISTEIVAAEHFVKSAARLVQTQDIIAKMAL
tara:strand:- start:1410 stop:1847 length:438 start_codon:yes stop_codon:yes gene_type:complete